MNRFFSERHIHFQNRIERFFNSRVVFTFAESSPEHFTDSNGVDLLQFFKLTLNKNTKDRYMLLRIEKELTGLAQDPT